MSYLRLDKTSVALRPDGEVYLLESELSQPGPLLQLNRSLRSQPRISQPEERSPKLKEFVLALLQPKDLPLTKRGTIDRRHWNGHSSLGHRGFCTKPMPPKEELIAALAAMKVRDVCIKYEVSWPTLNRWRKKYEISQLSIYRVQVQV